MRPTLRLPPHRLLPSTSRLRLRHASSFAPGPAPPRLPKADQELYERLQAQSTGAFSTPRTAVVQNPALSSSSTSTPPTAQSGPQQQQQQPLPQSTNQVESGDQSETAAAVDARVRATGEGEELHPDVRRGAKPEFEGERNPKTGEVGGPKNEPLRWGGGGDWSYNGRVTDF